MAMMSEAPSTSNEKVTVEPTAGETLFLAHLSSTYEDERESDEIGENSTEHPNGRKRRGLSIGEELWIVHCKRAEGVDLEPDEKLASSLEKKTKMIMPSNRGVATRAADRIISLRTRNVKIR